MVFGRERMLTPDEARELARLSERIQVAAALDGATVAATFDQFRIDHPEGGPIIVPGWSKPWPGENA